LEKLRSQNPVSISSEVNTKFRIISRMLKAIKTEGAFLDSIIDIVLVTQGIVSLRNHDIQFLQFK